ncbi:transcriptional regulator [Actinoplanes ianthinogenes]|uniref:Transcriptional regulator n=1 Tax=Actinoplanes ianthinogenes TaxID=122358 RepID=A0ABM7LLY1_9ACTN|nr:winged helix-turn-helix domain-containing protein [Actinoplanes ianthinogenes]BCJ40203.1 transcriptional regulator [Actinoplanes ianthinogenes]GGR10947.1 transcriptional regulator [Actinoplanes ianthinogenes]
MDRVRITDPRALRALAHPARVRLLELLTLDGPATGRQLADRIGESTASVSYHVAQLVKWGLVEPATELARGRERPWRATSRGITWPATGSPEFVAAARALRDQMVARRIEELDDYRRAEDTLDPVWREAAWFGEDGGYLTPAEVAEATTRIKAVIADYTGSRRPRTADARLVRFFAYALPTPPPPTPDAPPEPR